MTFSWDEDDDVCFVLDQHIVFSFYSSRRNNNSLIDMTLHSHTFSWSWVNHTLLCSYSLMLYSLWRSNPYQCYSISYDPPEDWSTRGLIPRSTALEACTLTKTSIGQYYTSTLFVCCQQSQLYHHINNTFFPLNCLSFVLWLHITKCTSVVSSSLSSGFVVDCAKYIIFPFLGNQI